MANGFEIKWDKNALDDVVGDVVKDYAVDLQKRIDTLSRLHKGKPVEQIKPLLQADFRQNGGSITDPELTEWAEAISEGVRIEVRT